MQVIMDLNQFNTIKDCIINSACSFKMLTGTKCDKCSKGVTHEIRKISQLPSLLLFSNKSAKLFEVKPEMNLAPYVSKTAKQNKMACRYRLLAIVRKVNENYEVWIQRKVRGEYKWTMMNNSGVDME